MAFVFTDSDSSSKMDSSSTRERSLSNPSNCLISESFILGRRRVCSRPALKKNVGGKWVRRQKKLVCVVQIEEGLNRRNCNHLGEQWGTKGSKGAMRRTSLELRRAVRRIVSNRRQEVKEPLGIVNGRRGEIKVGRVPFKSDFFHHHGNEARRANAWPAWRAPCPGA